MENSEIKTKFYSWLLEKDHLPIDILSVDEAIEIEIFTVPMYRFKGKMTCSWSAECGFKKKRITGYTQEYKTTLGGLTVDTISQIGSEFDDRKYRNLDGKRVVNKPVYETYTDWESKTGFVVHEYDAVMLGTDKLPGYIAEYIMHEKTSFFNQLDFSGYKPFDSEYTLSAEDVYQRDIVFHETNKLKQKVSIPGDTYRNLEQNISETVEFVEKMSIKLITLNYIYRENKYWYIFYGNRQPLANYPEDKESISSIGKITDKYWLPFLATLAGAFVLYVFGFKLPQVLQFSLFGIDFKSFSQLALLISFAPLMWLFFIAQKEINIFKESRRQEIKNLYMEKMQNGNKD